MSDPKKINITVNSARNMGQKSGSSVYAQVALSDDKGEKIGRPQETKCDKKSEPSWDSVHTYDVSSKTGDFSVNVSLFEQHMFSKDKYLGEVNFVFYPSKSTTVENWFSLQSKRNKVKVKGEVKIKVEFVGKVPAASSSSGAKPKVASGVNVDRSVLMSTLIDEPFTVVESKTVEWESYRDGPPEVSMEKFPSNSKANIVNKLDVNNNSGYYTMEAAKANCKVSGGKWYFEVTLNSSGRIYIGWCTPDYDPKSHTTGDAWSYDGYSNYKRRRDQSTQYGSEYWNNGDVIGCSIDYEKKSIHFYKNGKDLGEAFGSSDLPKKEELMPFVDLAGYMNVKTNFGATPFRYPVNGFNGLHLKLNKTQLAKLESRFQHYNRVAVEAGNEDENIIHSEGLDKLQKDLEIDGDGDLGFFILAWKLKCQEAFQISVEEWMNGFLMHGCEGMTAIKKQIQTWKTELNDDKQYKEFYVWLFHYMKKEGAKSIDFEEAKLLWGLLMKERKFKGQKWKYYDDWIEYCEKSAKVTSINANVWEMVWSFVNKYPADLSTYGQEQTCYPVLIDKFVDWVNGVAEESDGEDDL